MEYQKLSAPVNYVAKTPSGLISGSVTISPSIVGSITGENMELHYHKDIIGVSYKDKIILDLGASNGDSASYFLSEGAKSVIAVEGSPIYKPDGNFEKLFINSLLFHGKIIPIFMFIKSVKQIEYLIIEYKPDIIKCDIEGAEKHLYKISDTIWKMVPEYLIETHEGYLHDDADILVYKKCKQTKYKIVSDTAIFARVIYAKRED